MVRIATAGVPGWAVLLAGAFLLQTGCKKPDEDLGLALLPGDPLGTIVDTSALRAYSFADTMLRTSGLTRNLVGSYVDPDFGLLKTGIVTQVRLATSNVGLNQDTSGLQADSIVLALAFELPNSSYGNLNPQVFRVFEVAEDLFIDSLYHTDDFPEVVANDLVYPHRSLITPDPFNTVAVTNDTLVPQIRIRLKDELATRFLNAFGTADLVDNTSFLTFFKGLHIAVDNGVQVPYQAGILHINTLSTASKLTVYYKDANSSEPELDRTFDMLMNSNCVRYTVVERDRAQALTSAVEQALLDSTAPAPLLYLQTLGGSRAAIRFPGLSAYADQRLALARAELVLPIAGTYYPYYAPPSLLFLFRQVDGTDAFLPDETGGIGGIGGTFSAPDQEYRFAITRYVQGVLNGTIPDNGFEVVTSSNGVSANRAILSGPDHPDHPMRLELTFTTY